MGRVLLLKFCARLQAVARAQLPQTTKTSRSQILYSRKNGEMNEGKKKPIRLRKDRLFDGFVKRTH